MLRVGAHRSLESTMLKTFFEWSRRQGFGATCALVFFVGAPSLARSAEAPPQVEGFYTRGSLQSPSELPEVGPGLLRLFLPRDRGFGSSSLVDLIQMVAEGLSIAYPVGERLQVGDLSAEGGGKITRHSSHQNGLDVDLRYFAKDHREQDPQGVEGFDEAFVYQGKVTRNFDLERNWALLSSLALSGKVQRIFVDEAIKRKYCAQKRYQTPEGRETLRRLRPYPHHADHLHARLYCPSGQTQCESQSEVPEGSGCSRLRLRAFPWVVGDSNLEH